MKLSSFLLNLTILCCCLFSLSNSVVLKSYGLPLDNDLHCDNCMSGNLIPEGRTVQYFGEIYETMHVSSNGMISLGCGDAGDQLTWDTMAIISPYLTDIDTQLIDNVNIDGTVFYRTAVGGDSAFDTFALNHWGIDFLTSFEVVATYDKVRYSGETGTARNTFQAVVYVSSYGDTAVCYNYPTDGLNWPDAASTSYPLVGFYSGPDLNIAYSLPGSGTPAVVNLDSLVGNTGVVGQWCYLVSDTEVVSDCLITSLTCNAPRYFPVNVQIQSEDVLATYNLCNDQTLLIDVNTLKCADLGSIIPVTATIGYDSCITYFIAVTNQQLEYINCPDDITVNSNVPTTVNWAPPTATGDCLLPGQETINMLPNESLFQLGETIVTYTAYDVNYNSVSCSFEVTVAPQVVVTYIVLDVFNRPIVGASIGAFPDCEGTDNFGECSVLAPTLSLGDVIPAGEFFVTFNGVTYSIPHGDININCYQVDIVLIISPPGFYRAVGGDIIPCAPGTYSTIYEATTCISCDAGTFNDDYFATECELCPAGYTSGQGAIECYSCDAGSWLNLNTHLCELCPANTYSCDRALFCTPCPDGGYSTAGSAECHFCAAGYFLDPISHSCLPCAANTYSGDRATICTPCPLGSYSSQGSEVCTFCVSGFYLDINTYTCLSCPPGTYSCDRALQCTPCPEGGFSSAGSSECQFCTAGNFMGMNETVDTVCGCTPCPAGTFSCDRAEECLPCPPGYWSEPGSAFCFSCYAGYFLDTCDDCAGCYLCPANTFSNDRAVGECTPCPFGSYSFEGATSCIFCNEGYYFNGQNCQLCPAGTFSGDRADVCTPCPPGSYSFEGSAVCIYCSAGYFFDDSTASCLACPANTYSCDRAITCSACPTGSFSYPGSSNCSFCDAGYYLDADTHFCLACPAGFYSSLRADTCLACPEGFWSLPGSATCYSCTAGFYMDSNGNCQICPDGTTSGDRATECIAIPGQNEEIFCFAGYYFDVPSNSCHLCPANTYSNDRALSCTPCPFGSYSEAGSSECTFCIAGYYLDINLHTCLPCPANSFSTDRAIICLPCPYGYVSSIGSSTCLPCPDGSIVDPNSGNCVLCADGMFYLGGYCIPCTNAIPDECLNCPSGTESDVTCTECCAGFYSPNGSVCLPCPAGYYSGPAASECVYCPPDMVWDEGKRACVECDTSASSYSSHW